MYSFKPEGVCSSRITFDIEDGKLHNIEFLGGCNGNGKGVASLAEGMTPEEVMKRLSGITCGRKGTSCPDQLAAAMKEVLEEQKA